MVKKILFGFIFSVILLVPSWAKAEEINSFDVTARIQENGSVQVSEKIEYDFGQEERHGIFRNIPYKYTNSLGNFTIGISKISVTDESGQKLNFTTSKGGSDVIIKIGDKNKTITGAHTYVIQYTIKKTINFFDDSDEFYWNVTGNGWEVPIDAASATVIFPKSVLAEEIGAACYAGAAGENTPCAEQQIDTAAHFSQRNLAPWNGLTIAVSFPKGLVKEPSQWQKKLAIFLDNAIVGLPLIVFIVMIFLWRKYGKDPSGQGVVVAQFDAPEGMTPAEVGLVVDERADNKDISAEIINLAVQGYIRINRIEKDGVLSKKTDYEFEQLKPSKSLQADHQKTVMVALFGANEENIKPEKVLLSSLRYSSQAYEEIKKIDYLVTAALIKKGCFKFSPGTVRGLYFFAGIVLVVLGSFLTGVFASPVLTIFSFLISGIIIMIFSRWMPARTKKGVLAREHILGLKNYLTVAEAERIKFHNAPEKNPAVFEKLLPYAMVLGVEQAWAKQFESIYVTPPDWYHDSMGGQFSALALTSNFSGFRSDLYHTLTSNRSSAANYTRAQSSASYGGRGSSGGGFSGGGFGGGGGGSW